jgi:hypothetical protein
MHHKTFNPAGRQNSSLITSNLCRRRTVIAAEVVKMRALRAKRCPVG